MPDSDQLPAFVIFWLCFLALIWIAFDDYSED